MNRNILMVGICIGMLSCLAGCGVAETIRRNDDRYARPGALDPAIPINPYYVKHSFNFLSRYQVSHEWTNLGNGSCSYGSYPGTPPGLPLRVFDSLGKIYEKQLKTWYQSDESYAGLTKNGQIRRTDFDQYVRSVISEYRTYTDVYGVLQTRGGKQVGFEPVCFESWWVTSHYIRLSLHKRDLETQRRLFAERYPEGKWTRQQVGNNLWLVQQTPEQDFRPRRPNGVGGPFQSWLLPIGDTDYTFVLEFGASKESLHYPEAHANVQAMFHHLIESFKIEPLKAP